MHVDPERFGSVRGGFAMEFGNCGCNEIAASLYHRLAVIEANFWRQTLTSDCKEIWTSGGCLTATSLELKLNGNSTSN